MADDNVIQFVPGLRPSKVTISSVPLEMPSEPRRTVGPIVPIGDLSDWYISTIISVDTSPCEYVAPTDDCA